MSNNELLVKVAAILTTIAEVGGAPESTLYIGVCNTDMAEWSMLRCILTEAKLVTIKGNYVTLTQLGHEKAELLNRLAS